MHHFLITSVYFVGVGIKTQVLPLASPILYPLNILSDAYIFKIIAMLGVVHIIYNLSVSYSGFYYCEDIP